MKKLEECSHENNSPITYNDKLHDQILVVDKPYTRYCYDCGRFFHLFNKEQILLDECVWEPVKSRRSIK